MLSSHTRVEGSAAVAPDEDDDDAEEEVAEELEGIIEVVEKDEDEGIEFGTPEKGRDGFDTGTRREAPVGLKRFEVAPPPALGVEEDRGVEEDDGVVIVVELLIPCNGRGLARRSAGLKLLVVVVVVVVEGSLMGGGLKTFVTPPPYAAIPNPDALLLVLLLGLATLMTDSVA